MRSTDTPGAPGIWRRPGLIFPAAFDTIFFDVDGVLIKTTSSFRATDIAVAEYVTGTLNGLDWGQREGKALVTLEDVAAFKQAGGYNNDWDMCYLLAALSTARLREWRDTALAERSSQEWAVLSRQANLQGRGGVTWVNEVVPHSALPDYAQVGEIYHECYWGVDEYRKRYGRLPRYLADAPGFVHREEMLYAAGFPKQLREAGIKRMGLITGRVGPEVDSAVERMQAHSGERWWEVVISADESPKPDARALQLAIEAVGARGGLYLGDTADDFDLVINYRAVKSVTDPEILIGMLVGDEEAHLYQARGADFVMPKVEDVIDMLAHRERKVSWV